MLFIYSIDDRRYLLLMFGDGYHVISTEIFIVTFH